jgi:hypothetical protein
MLVEQPWFANNVGAGGYVMATSPYARSPYYDALKTMHRGK